MKSTVNLDKIPKWKSRRKFSYINPKRKDINEKEMPYSLKLSIKSKKGFMLLLSDINVETEILKRYNYEWYMWLYNWYNPKRKEKQIRGFEDIPFYHKSLEKDFINLYEAISFREKFLKKPFIELGTKFELKKRAYQELFESTKSLEALEKINQNGAFYYKLPKKYKFFEMSLKGSQTQSNEKINIPSKKLTKLSKHLVYFGIIDISRKNTSKPYFLGYYSEQELSKKSRFNGVERMTFLKHNLKQKDILGNTLEGNFIWDIDDIPKSDLKTDVLVLVSKGAFFDSYESFILEGDK